MIPRLFVDVDDTLVIYESDQAMNPYGYYMETPYILNIDLIEAIKNYNGILIVWSGGGREYAQMWADKIGLSEALCLSKDFSMIRKGDIVIDDMDIPCRTHDPFSWF